MTKMNEPFEQNDREPGNKTGRNIVLILLALVLVLGALVGIRFGLPAFQKWKSGGQEEPASWEESSGENAVAVVGTESSEGASAAEKPSIFLPGMKTEEEAAESTAQESPAEQAAAETPASGSFVNEPEDWTKESIYFGNYEQDGNIENGKEPIEWIVLEDEGDNLLIMTRYCIACRPISDSQGSCTWDNCSLRIWLNEDFLEKAFSGEESANLAESSVSPDTNKNYGTDAGRNVNDQIFILSASEVERYLVNGAGCLAECTDEAKNQGILVKSEEGVNTSPWQLRTPGKEQETTMSFVNTYGHINYEGKEVTNRTIGVRPAARIRKSADITIKVPVALSEAKAGDFVNFGVYEKDNNLMNGKEPLEWIVLEESGEDLLLIARYCIDCISYNETSNDNTWENSTLRVWLNGEFLSNTFSAAEISRLKMSHNLQDNSNPSDVSGGAATEERVFILSAAEADTYFKSSAGRLAERTEYSAGKHIFVNEEKNGTTSPWLLRTPGNAGSDKVAFVNSVGGINYEGEIITAENIGIRPVIWVSKK